jgi:serine/threonine protein kinase
MRQARTRLAEIFELARELPADARAACLDRECAGKPELRRQVEELLLHDHTQDDLLERPAWEGIITQTNIADDTGAGQRLGVPETRLESLPGSVLDQKYRIERLLGKGAMGAVFEATHLGTVRTVALKVIVPKLADRAEFLQRFQREAEAAGRLRHVNVVNVTDFGVTRSGDGAGMAYLVMEYLDGQTLSSYLKSDPRPSLDFILDIIEQVALALDAAHAVGVVHRDLKPGNIWLEPNHRGGYNVKVLDFGIAKVSARPDDRARRTGAAMETETAGEDDLTALMPAGREPSLQGLLETPSSLMTTVGTLLGTPAYMAPEQCQGLVVDGRADVYSLAVIAYEMLCGRLPFESEDYRQLVYLHVHETPVGPYQYDHSVPSDLSNIVLESLNKDPALRPSSAGALATKLRALAEGELTLLRRSKDVFHTHTPCFLPLLILCLAPVITLASPLRILAHAALEANLAPAWVLTPGLELAYLALILFGLQLYKVACLRVLEKAMETGKVQLELRSAISGLARGLPVMLRTQLRSMLDLRPASFRDNLLWPVVQAKEHCSGKQAIDRSRELCRILPRASIALMVRQYAPLLVGFLWLPTVFLGLGAPKRLMPDGLKETLSDSSVGWLVLFNTLFFTSFYLNIGSAFSFLYWSALRCRGEVGEVSLPLLSRSSGRKRDSIAGLRPATLLWIAAPVAMLALILVRLWRRH